MAFPASASKVEVVHQALPIWSSVSNDDARSVWLLSASRERYGRATALTNRTSGGYVKRMHEKDPFGDKLKEAEHGQEDQYFAARDRELMAKLKESRENENDARARTAAHDRCPRDGEPLHKRKLHGVVIEECPKCKGIWLDHGDLKTLAERERGGFFGRWFLGERDG